MSEDQSKSRRREERQTAGGKATFEVVQSDDPDVVGGTFEADVLEVSRNGIRLAGDDLITDGRLDLRIQIKGHDQVFELFGEVRWASMEENGEYQMGVEIIDDPGTDVEEWGALGI